MNRFQTTLAAALCLPGAALACAEHDMLADSGDATAALFKAKNESTSHDHNHASPRADAHAPIGVMGEHRHAAGEVMLSYRYMRMHMEGNLLGSDDISPDTIATTIPNRFANPPMMPPTLRVVPLEMDMDMHMLGAMYAPSDELTLMAMVPYIHKDMLHRTYQGGMPTTDVLGTFRTEAKGLGDIGLSALYKVGLASGNAHFNLGLSLPTGSIDESDDVLAPNGMTPTLRLPYPMQLGSGTYDLKPGFTWYERNADVTLGAQYLATIRLGRNDEEYRHGHAQELTAWGSLAFGPAVSASLRLAYREQGRVKGIDAQRDGEDAGDRIAAPVQTADPDRQGGERLDIGLGLNLVGQQGALKGQRLALEFLAAVHQDLNGPQLETDNSLIAGWQYAW